MSAFPIIMMYHMNRNNNHYGNYNSNSDDGFGCLIAIILAGGIITVGGIVIANSIRQKESESTKYNLIVMMNGEEYRFDDKETKKEIDGSYSVYRFNDKTMAVVVYGINPTEKNEYTDFIESCIYLDQNNNVYFDEEAATDEKYTVYQMQAKSQEKIKRKTL